MKVCTTAYAVTARENYFSVATNCVEIRLWFVTDSTQESARDSTESSRRSPTAW